MMRDKEHLIRVFMVDGEPYMLRYRKLGHTRKDWLADKVLLNDMIKEGTVRIVHQDRTTITYKYTPKL